MVPSRRTASGPNRLRMAASAGVPGRHHLARQHVGVDHRHAGLAQASGDVALPGRNAAGQRNLPDHIAAFRASSQFRGRHGVAQHHRDRQRADAARHRRQRAGDRFHVRMDIADEDAALLRELPRACGCPPGKSARPRPASVSVLMPTSITVAPGLTNSRVTNAGPADRRDQNIRRPRHRRQVRPCASGRP